MYNYAFFSRILAIVAFLLVLLLCLPVSIQHFRLRSRLIQSQNSVQNAYRANMMMNSLIPELVRYGQRDPSIFQVLQKYGIPPPPIPQPGQAPAPKQKKK